MAESERAHDSLVAALFDLDGTLIDTENISTQAIAAVITPLGGSIDWHLKKRLLGMRGPDWARIVIDDQQLGAHLTAEQLVDGWETALDGLYDQVALLPGAMSLISELQQAGLRLGMCTSSSKSAVAKKRRTKDDLFRAFDVIVSGDDAELVRGKPAPDIFLLAAARLGVRADRCVAFEDALSGCQAAFAAGCFVVAVPDERLDLEPFRACSHVLLPNLTHAAAALAGRLRSVDVAAARCAPQQPADADLA